MAFKYGKRRSKYNNTKVQYEGLKFDSKVELERYKYLRELEVLGEIEDLAVHPRFPLTLPGGIPVMIKGAKRKTHSRYVPDFSYYLSMDGMGAKEGTFIVEDVKGVPTAREGYFKLKRAIFEAIYGVEVVLVFRKRGEWILEKMAP